MTHPPDLPVRFDSLDPERGARSFHFTDRVGEAVAWTIAEVVPALRKASESVAGGAFAAGFVAYEAAAAFDPAMTTHSPAGGLPLVHFGLYRSRAEVEPLRVEGPDSGSYRLGSPVAALGPDEYRRRVERVLDLIAAGDSYQVNLTFPLRGTFDGSPLALYRDLLRAQRSAFCALLAVGVQAIVSASPELFFRVVGREIELRPMKGTRPRGRWTAEDDDLAREVATSPKERAENLMIVDLLRNDLGRIAEFGSVQVPRLFEVEHYPTVHQLTSTVTGTLRDGVGIVDIFAALFPSGSVTGAPKIHTTGIIRDLEDSARGPYTGAIGFFGPGDATFSVGIRTVVVDMERGSYRLDVGSGITADSDADAEYAECLGKGAFLTHRPEQFELLESLRFEKPGGFVLLDSHLDRMAESARYFGFRFDRHGVRSHLDSAVGGLDDGVYKIRLLASPDGTHAVETEPIAGRSEPVRLGVSDEAVDPADPFLYHKTTRRALYRRALSSVPEADDAILRNVRGEICETTTSNIAAEIDGRLVTPPIECGLLPGTLRAQLLEEGRIATRVLHLDDLHAADAVYLVNSVRGWRTAILPGRETAPPSTGSTG